ncbi:DnaJ domain-containing protein [Dyella sp. 2HG41-7]|uniref:J domain-containing protein n=1 Tax=Dyella sp. 2HG41-7 TaxID=2883239 RepID=UPI001F2A2F0F|nr:DnaJ domain-containing protein [Dyella sp. 2HG41-7]
MTAVDIIVIAAGLLFGYRLVSNYLSPTVDKSAPRNERPQSDSPRQQTWERNWESAEPRGPAWFETLGVPENADQAEIDRAYRLKISQYHPDKVAQMGEDIRRMAEAKTKEINAAYEAAMKSRRR